MRLSWVPGPWPLRVFLSGPDLGDGDYLLVKFVFVQKKMQFPTTNSSLQIKTVSNTTYPNAQLKIPKIQTTKTGIIGVEDE